jgi:hypothetical protein
MYPLLSQWTAEQAMDRRYDPDRLDRGPVYTLGVSATRRGLLSRPRAAMSRLRATTQLWVRRATLGPQAGPCDPAGQGW